MPAVLVASNFSQEADEALRQGSVAASAAPLPLVVGHVLPESFRVRVLFPHEAGVDASLGMALEGRAREVLRARADAVLPPGTDVAFELDSGSPSTGILEIAERVGAALIVLGPGRTAHRVAQAAACPVLVARPSPVDGPVIGASDFSDAALPALRAAAEAARRTHVALRLMHCLDVDQAVAMAAVGVGGAVALPALSDATYGALRSAAEATLTRAVTSLDACGEAVVVRGTPGPCIVAEASATGASLVVVGTRGGSLVRHWLLGSTTEYVMAHAPCSVMVVPLDSQGDTPPRAARSAS